MANYKIETVAGIGPEIGEKLRGLGVFDTDSLLANARTPADRQKLADASGLPSERILKFANMADLFRISGVSKEFAELLDAAGVDSLHEFLQRNPETLAKRLASLNQEQDIVRHVPPSSNVTRWFEQAKLLPRMLEA